jgi:hypothetical protein
LAGASIKESIHLLNERRDRIEGRVAGIETRKVIFPVDQMLGKENSLLSHSVSKNFICDLNWNVKRGFRGQIKSDWPS